MIDSTPWPFFAVAVVVVVVVVFLLIITYMQCFSTRGLDCI